MHEQGSRVHDVPREPFPFRSRPPTPPMMPSLTATRMTHGTVVGDGGNAICLGNWAHRSVMHIDFIEPWVGRIASINGTDFKLKLLNCISRKIVDLDNARRALSKCSSTGRIEIDSGSGLCRCAGHRWCKLVSTHSSEDKYIGCKLSLIDVFGALPGRAYRSRRVNAIKRARACGVFRTIPYQPQRGILSKYLPQQQKRQQ